MATRYNKTHYRQKGIRQYEAGIVRIFAGAKDWRQKAFQDGYKEAREAWKAGNPDADEWEAMRARNEAFCKRALGVTQ